MSEQTPFLASYAKSGSESCCICKEIFAENTLQLAVTNQADMKSDIDNKWFHLNCFFTKEKPKSVEEIGNFSTLLKEDQKQVRSKIDEIIALAEAELNGLKSAPEMRDFFIEYAKSTSAGFLSGCDERFRNALRDDDHYLTDSLPQEFSDVLKRLDLTDETDDEEEARSENSSTTNDEDKYKTISEDPEQDKSDLVNPSDCIDKHKDISEITKVQESLANDPTQHGNNFITYQMQHDNQLEFHDCASLQDVYYFVDNEFEETEFDQDEIGEDEIFSEEDFNGFGSEDSEQYYDSDDDIDNCNYEKNYSNELEQDTDICDYGDCAALYEEIVDVCEGTNLDYEETGENLWNGKGFAHQDEFDNEFGYAPK